MSARRRHRPAVPVAAVLCAVLALAGCTTAAPANAPPETGTVTGLPAGVTVELRQLRSDVAARQAQVMITNGGAEPLTVGALRVDDPRFDGPAERLHDRESSIRAGGTVAIPVQLPPVACPGGDESAATVTLSWSTEDDSGQATAALADPLAFVPPLHERECRAVALAQAADVSISDFAPSPPGEPARLTLTVAPTGRAAAEVVGIHSTNLLTWVGHPGVVYPLEITVGEGDAEPLEVRLPLVPLRCDPHAVQEDKRGTVFNVDIAIDGEPGQIQLAATEEMRGRILTWVGEWCEFPS